MFNMLLSTLWKMWSVIKHIILQCWCGVFTERFKLLLTHYSRRLKIYMHYPVIFITASTKYCIITPIIITLSKLYRNTVLLRIISQIVQSTHYSFTLSSLTRFKVHYSLLIQYIMRHILMRHMSDTNRLFDHQYQ